MRKPTAIDELPRLKEELRSVRERSLLASRQNDFRTVAMLTAETARLNRAIHSQEEFAGCSKTALAIVDALSNLDDVGTFVFPRSGIPDEQQEELLPEAA